MSQDIQKSPGEKRVEREDEVNESLTTTTKRRNTDNEKAEAKAKEFYREFPVEFFWAISAVRCSGVANMIMQPLVVRDYCLKVLRNWNINSTILNDWETFKKINKIWVQDFVDKQTEWETEAKKMSGNSEKWAKNVIK